MKPLILKTKYAFHLLAAFLKPEVVLDIGSMDGADSKRFARILPRANIVAFEGNPYNYRSMRADETLRNSSVRLENRLVSNRTGESRIFVQRPSGDDAGFNRGTSSTLQRSIDGARSEEVVLESVRTDEFLDSEFSTVAAVAAWVDVEGHAHGVIDGMAGASDRIKLIHVEVETSEIWPGQKLERDVLSLASDLGFCEVARSRGAVQRDIILLNQSWYKESKATIDKILKVSALIGPTASRIVETRLWREQLSVVAGKLLS